MIELDLHDSAYLAVCKHYMAIYNTPMISDDERGRNEVCSVCFLLHNSVMDIVSKSVIKLWEKV